MANIHSYSYDYFCGANVTVALDNDLALELAGISYSMQDSQRPIYGYNARFFNAVAPGQEIIQGSFVLNFVSPNYLVGVLSRDDDDNFLDGNSSEALTLLEGKRMKYWGDPKVAARTSEAQLGKADVQNGLATGIINGFDININYGDKWSIELIDCFITSRGQTIQIDHETILEEYSFFARRAKTFQNT